MKRRLPRQLTCPPSPVTFFGSTSDQLPGSVRDATLAE
jgi:hypothetical protein